MIQIVENEQLTITNEDLREMEPFVVARVRGNIHEEREIFWPVHLLLEVKQKHFQLTYLEDCGGRPLPKSCYVRKVSAEYAEQTKRNWKSE
jgi:hypothetical protein